MSVDGPPRLAIGLTAQEAADAAEARQLGRALALLTKPLGLGKLFTEEGPTDLACGVLAAKRGYDQQTTTLLRAAWCLWEELSSPPTLDELRAKLRPEDARRLWALMHAIARGRVGLWLELHRERRHA